MTTAMTMAAKKRAIVLTIVLTIAKKMEWQMQSSSSD
jgi:hypothetical protein